MKLKYTDGPAALTIDGLGVVERGQEVDVSGDQAKRLLEQGWEKAGAKSTSSTKKKTTRAKKAPKAEAKAQADGTTTPPESPASTTPAA